MKTFKYLTIIVSIFVIACSQDVSPYEDYDSEFDTDIIVESDSYEDSSIIEESDSIIEYSDTESDVYDTESDVYDTESDVYDTESDVYDTESDTISDTESDIITDSESCETMTTFSCDEHNAVILATSQSYSMEYGICIITVRQVKGCGWCDEVSYPTVTPGVDCVDEP
jgi:hypothetical protein